MAMNNCISTPLTALRRRFRSARQGAAHVSYAAAWSADGTRLFYTTSGVAEALYSVSTSDLRPRLIARGRFQGLAITPEGDLAVLSKQVQDGRNLLNHLVLIETADGNERIVVQGQRDEAALQPLAIR